MKKYQYNEITLMQYIFFIHGTQLGSGQLALPRLLAEKAGVSGWISLLMGWFGSVAVSLLIVSIMKRYPDGAFPDLLVHYFGKTIGKIAVLMMTIFYAFSSLTSITSTGLMIQQWILPHTPLYVLIILFSIPTYLIARNGLRVISRYTELIFFLTIGMVFFMVAPLKNGHPLHLLPILGEGWGPLLQGALVTVFSFLGFDSALIAYPFLQKKQAAAAGIIIANTLSMLVFLITVLSCFVFFSPDEITYYQQPTLDLLKVVEFRFVERLEIVFLSGFLTVISATWITLMYNTVFCTSWLLGKQDHQNHVLVLLVLIILSAYFLDPSTNQLEDWYSLLNKTGFLYAFVMPVGLWLYLRGKELSQGRRRP
ncbi:GerAB/ArcD/ProY family transporter [Paenibacillus sp. OAS669]|uniref:GerAB/ArcD/ProY family transporter n=1 Tax=Paenibacillus sp. OAS669 TaxID=2663821 RepID=UPI001789F4C7|nr:GerAB/ArcD/ProY family transporter [Paenibacillus sp. OAS669]MBE1443648.1 spore germination protein (amino acid permease) [Paenibacillus sp. OAS669]